MIERVVLASARLPELAGAGARAALNGAWLGLLPDAALRAVDERYYDSQELYRTADWNERGLFAWERALVDAHFAGRERLVVCACGGGREVLALLRDGVDAAGYESHPALAAYARRLLAERGHPGRIEAVARDTFPAADCDGAIVGWGAYSLIHGAQRRVAFLREARLRLAPGSPLLLSFFERDALGRELRATLAIANALRRLRRAPAVEPGDTMAPNRVHVFTPAQVADEAAAGGFEPVARGSAGIAEKATRHAYAVLRAA